MHLVWTGIAIHSKIGFRSFSKLNFFVRNVGLLEYDLEKEANPCKSFLSSSQKQPFPRMNPNTGEEFIGPISGKKPPSFHLYYETNF